MVWVLIAKEGLSGFVSPKVFVNYFNEEISEEEAKKTINDIYKNIIPLNYLLIELDKIYGFIYVKDLYKYAKHIFDNK